MSNFILVDDYDSKVKNSPLTVGINLYFNKDFSCVDDMINTPKLSDVENGNVSHIDYIIGNIYKKVEDDFGLDPEQKLINFTLEHIKVQKLRTMEFNELLSAKPKNLMILLNRARSICHSILKDFDPWKVKPRLTSGATEDTATGEDIVTRIRSANERSLDALGNSLKHWYLSQVPSLDVNRTSSTNDGSYVAFHSTVKDLRINRPLGYHEVFQLAVQCGVGDHFGSLLRRATGINISTAQDWHRFLVEYYSTEPGTICTMDQSNASQNILRAHAKFLLPEDVYALLDAISPDKLLIGDKLYHIEMLAAQGNGYIFQLQTIIFYSLISACVDYDDRKHVYQYGDDSIFPAKYFDLVTKFFGKIGFEVNKDKSFVSSTLESCGADFINGINVRPYYVSKIPRTTRDWYHVCNGIYRVGYVNHNNTWRSDAFKRLWLWSITNIPISQRFFGPAVYGDDVITYHCERRYTFNHKRTKIRSLGIDLREGKSFSSLTQRISANEVSKILIHPSMKNAGLRRRSDSEIKRIAKIKNITIENVPSVAYPNVLGKREYVYTNSWKPYPVPKVTQHEDVDYIFMTLGLDSVKMLDVYERRRVFYINRIVYLLKKISDIKSCINVDDIEL